MKFALPALLALALAVPAGASAGVVRADLSGERPELIKIGDKGKHRGKGKGRSAWDDDRDERRAYRQGVRDGRRQARERQYYQPGYRDYARSDYRRYRRGQYLPPEHHSYVVHDYNRYGYPPPPRGCHYVRVGQDTYLTQIATGLILNAFLGGGY